jgi:hypothetical protein
MTSRFFVNARASALVWALMLAAPAAFWACGDDDDSTDTTPALGGEGDPCTATAECDAALVCAADGPKKGTCTANPGGDETTGGEDETTGAATDETDTGETTESGDTGDTTDGPSPVIADPTRLSFGLTAITTSKTLDVTIGASDDALIELPSDMLIQINRVILSGQDDDGPFEQLLATPTPVAFKATETFAFPVRFTPVDLVSYTGALAVEWKFVGAVVPEGLPERGSFSINLDGQGTASPFRVAPPSGLDFEEGFLGEESVALAVSVTNESGATAGILSFESDTGDFVAKTGPAPLPLTLADAAKADFTVTFRPTATGLRAGNLIIKTDDLTVPELRVPLTGIGKEADKTRPVAVIRILGTTRTDGEIFLDAENGLPYVTLDGNASTDPGGKAIKAWSWRLIDGPAGAKTKFTATLPSGVQQRFETDLPGLYKIGLKVTNQNGIDSANEAESLQAVYVNDSFELKLTHEGSFGPTDTGSLLGCPADFRNADIVLVDGSANCSEVVVTPASQIDANNNFSRYSVPVEGGICGGQWGPNSQAPRYFDDAPRSPNSRWRTPERVQARLLAQSKDPREITIRVNYRENQHECARAGLLQCNCAKGPTNTQPTKATLEYIVGGKTTETWSLTLNQRGQNVDVAKIVRQFGKNTKTNLVPSN